jgi:hypothetical protein
MSLRPEISLGYILPFSGVVERNVVLVEDGAGGALERGARLHIGALRGDLGGLGLRQQALILNHEERRGGADFEFGLLGRERFLLQRRACTAA